MGCKLQRHPNLSSKPRIRTCGILCSDLVLQHSHEENRHSAKLYNANRVRLPEVDSSVSGIVPPDIRRSSHTLKICAKAKANYSHLLHEITCNSDINPNLRLNNRKSFRTQCTQLNNTPTADTPNKWAETTWHTRWQANSTHLQKYISTPNKHPPGHDLNRHCWVRLNRLRTGHGRFGHIMQNMGLREDAACSCGEAKQTAEHVINFCPDTKCYGGFLALDKAATDWLHKLNIDI